MVAAVAVTAVVVPVRRRREDQPNEEVLSKEQYLD
jgi:hypothetical protein